uniref:Uncharacterized protein n=1 Tax=Anguilla anguilla TaxID=7936 RepID=A0A0E9XUD7_ANGAN
MSNLSNMFHKLSIFMKQSELHCIWCLMFCIVYNNSNYISLSCTEASLDSYLVLP